MSLFSSLVGPAIQIGTSLVGALAEDDLNDRRQSLEERNLKRNRDAQLRELDRQESRTPNTFIAQRDDIMRRSTAALGRLGAFTSEAGTSGSTSTRLLNELRFATGTDLARVDYNEMEELEAIDAAREAVKTGFGSDIAVSRNRRDTQSVATWLGVGASALQIGGAWYGRWAERQAATNRID